MIPSRANLFGPFVSLGQALEAIARRVSVPETQITAHQPPNERLASDDYGQLARRAAIRDRLARSRAASLLLQCLNLPHGQRPSWQELHDGVAIHDESAFRDGLRWLALEERGAVGMSPSLELDVDRCAYRVGFDVDELADRLDGCGIPHTLVRASAAPSPSSVGGNLEASRLALAPSDPLAVATTTLAAHIKASRTSANYIDSRRATPGAPGTVSLNDVRVVTEALAGDDLARAVGACMNAVPVPCPPSLPAEPMSHRLQGVHTHRFNGAIAEALKTAVSKARDPRDHRSVFAALCELAKAPAPPIPLLGYNAADNAVLWNDGDRDQPKSFTKKDMYSRMRPRTAGRKRKVAKNSSTKRS